MAAAAVVVAATNRPRFTEMNGGAQSGALFFGSAGAIAALPARPARPPRTRASLTRRSFRLPAPGADFVPRNRPGMRHWVNFFPNSRSRREDFATRNDISAWGRHAFDDRFRDQLHGLLELPAVQGAVPRGPAVPEAPLVAGPRSRRRGTRAGRRVAGTIRPGPRSDGQGAGPRARRRADRGAGSGVADRGDTVGACGTVRRRSTRPPPSSTTR